MSWNFSNDVPIYLQIMEHFKVQIASGKLEVGDKIQPVRELALEAGVNPNTMQKALSELEREGYLESQRTSGRFVADRGKQDRLILTQRRTLHILLRILRMTIIILNYMTILQ